MAIVEMKRMTLLALQKDKEKLLHAIQRMGCIQVSDIPDDEIQPYISKVSGLVVAEDAVTRLRWAVDKLGRYNKSKASMFGTKTEVDRDKADAVYKQKEHYMQIVSAAERLEQRVGELKGLETRLHASIEQLAPWAGLDVPVSLLHNTKETMQEAGSISKNVLAQLTSKWAAEPVVISEVGSYQETVYVHVVAHQSVAPNLLADLKDAGFAPAIFADMQGTPRNQLDTWEKDLKEIADGYKQLDNEYVALSSELPNLKLLYDILLAERDRLQAAKKFASTETTFLLRGWVPSALYEKVRNRILEVSPTASVEAHQPEKGDEPPVMLHNNNIIAPFESVVAGFSLPSPNSLDPTVVMAPFFACFFGMMVSDAGYGLLMALAIPLIIKFAKPSSGAKKLMWILAIGGISTVFWGFMYNTWFGFAPLPLFFDPVNNALPVMGLCIGIGALHLFSGLFMGAYQNIKRGQPLDALYDQLSWFMLVVGLGLLLLPATAQVGTIMALAGVVIILLTAGRNKSTNPIKRIISGLGALYGVTSWVSDLLSYMRLFGMGLATGVIGMVINQLVGMVFEAGIIGKIIGSALFVGGHLFNAGINILGAYVHSCRLQYIEFFGKFYEDGGKPFTPLAEDMRYVHINDAPQVY